MHIEELNGRRGLFIKTVRKNGKDYQYYYSREERSTTERDEIIKNNRINGTKTNPHYKEKYWGTKPPENSFFENKLSQYKPLASFIKDGKDLLIDETVFRAMILNEEVKSFFSGCVPYPIDRLSQVHQNKVKSLGGNHADSEVPEQGVAN